MISGSTSIPRVQEESVCRSSKPYTFTEVGMYCIHSNALMSHIPFGEAEQIPEVIDDTIYLNDDETKPVVPKQTKCQNYLTTKYVGRAPLEFYSGSSKTEVGRQFLLKCINGIPTEKYRVFGTEAAIRGFNKDAADNSQLPGGGEM